MAISFTGSPSIVAGVGVVVLVLSSVVVLTAGSSGISATAGISAGLDSVEASISALRPDVSLFSLGFF